MSTLPGVAVKMAIASAGYSGKSLPEKLGYKAGQSAALIGLPPDLEALAGSVPFGSLRRADWGTALAPRTFDLIHAFTARKADLDAHLADLQAALKPNGAIWISWPKKAAKAPTDLTEDRIREAAVELDLVDVKVCAVDAKWSGLKLVIRKERR